MKNLRTYGDPPFKFAVLHGGPGAPGQVQELRSILEEICVFPVTLIGSSWGAMLGFIFSAYHPKYVKKLILIGSGVYEGKFAVNIQEKRLNRLNDNERGEAQILIEKLSHPETKEKNRMSRSGDTW